MNRNQERQAERYAENMAYLREVKSQPCMDCGGTFPQCAMDLDHRPGEEKTRSGIARFAHGGAERFRQEVARCDVVCANCHRIRTFLEREHFDKDGNFAKR